MNRRKFLLGSAAALTGSGLLVGTQGSSRVESHRTVRVQVEDDSDAYLLLEYPIDSVTVEGANCSAWAPLLLVGNQTRERLDEITVDLVNDLDDVSIADVEFCYQGNGESCFSDEDEEEYGYDGGTFTLPPLSQGEQVLLRAELACEHTTGGETIRFDIEAAGEDTGILAHRAEEGIDVTCDCGVEETAWAYGGSKSSGGACAAEDNPFVALFGNGDGNSGNGNTGCRGQWGWYITQEQLKRVNGTLTLYAGAGRNNLDSGLAVGDLYVEIKSDSEGNEELFVNYLVDDSVGDKSIELKSTKFTVVEDADDILNNGGEGVAPGGWSPKHSDPGDGKVVSLDGIDSFVLAAHAEVTITESSG